MSLSASFRDIRLKDANLKKNWLDVVCKNENQANIFNIYINTDIEESSDPLDFMGKICSNYGANFEIKDRAILQINEAVDISQPKHLRNKLEVSAKGTLKLLLTDGVNSIIGITKTNINNFINPASEPGSKVLLKPPVAVRYGVALLSNNNIQFYGGRSAAQIQKRNDVFKKVSNIRRIVKTKNPNNSNLLQNEKSIEIQQKAKLREDSNSENSSMTKNNIGSFPSSPSASLSPSPSRSPPHSNDFKKEHINTKQKEKAGQLTIIEKSPPKHSKPPKLRNSFQFLSSDDDDFDSSDSYQEIPNSL